MSINRQVVIPVLISLLSGVACRPGDILNVSPPSGEFTSSALQGPGAVLQAFYGARSQLADVIGGSDATSIIYASGLFSDEFTARVLSNGLVTSYGDAALDARYASMVETPIGVEAATDQALENLLGAHLSLTLAQMGLQRYASTSNPETIGEAFALEGYAELFLAEAYCAGVTLNKALPQGGWGYGAPLTTDSLLGVAEAHFDSALAHANQNDTIQGLASIGLGRTLLDRQQPAAAAAAVQGVSTAFVYNTQLEPVVADNTGYPNFYEYAVQYGSHFTVSDVEGTNGLNFVSAQDPRLVFNATLAKTIDGVFYHAVDSVYNYPLKFGNPSTGRIPLATGIEARLIEAEAALTASPSDPTWLNDLNALRTGGCPDNTQADCTYGTGQVPAQSSGLFPLTDPGTDTGRVSLLFHERAFWLFGTGTRLGDLRRLVRQYHRPNESVYPTGAYITPMTAGLQNVIQTYGTDVTFTLPTPNSGYTTTNQNYAGCLTPTTQA